MGFEKIYSRMKRSGPGSELLIRAAKPEGQRAAKLGGQSSGSVSLRAIDATAGSGDDAFILASAGYEVLLFERDPVLAAAIEEKLRRALDDPGLKDAASRMTLVKGDSIDAMKRLAEDGSYGNIDLIYLDPMFSSKKKSALSKKQMEEIRMRQAESKAPESAEREAEEQALLDAAAGLGPEKIIIKRPLKGPFLCGRVPAYSIKGKLIRYDCIVLR